MEKKNISYTVENDLCLGCGICQDACPLHAIEVKAIKGTFSPIVNEEICANGKGCHRCFDICPGVGINLKQIAKNNFNQDNINYDTYGIIGVFMLDILQTKKLGITVHLGA